MNSYKPNKHLMAIATYLSLLPLVYFVPKLLNPYLPESELLRLMILLAIIVPITSYLILPNFVRVLRHYQCLEISY